jgi:hypothetical protein
MCSDEPMTWDARVIKARSLYCNGAGFYLVAAAQVGSPLTVTREVEGRRLKHWNKAHYADIPVLVEVTSLVYLAGPEVQELHLVRYILSPSGASIRRRSYLR